jgi:transposase
MMKFYNSQHQFYCGIDLHAKTLYVCVLDNSGTKRLHKNFQCQNVEGLLEELQPFREDLVVGCQSTFNWYWLADLMNHEKIPFILGHALYMKAIHGGKTKSDAIDSEKIARLIRGGNFPLAHAYPKEHRATRDLLRRSLPARSSRPSLREGEVLSPHLHPPLGRVERSEGRAERWERDRRSDRESPSPLKGARKGPCI